MDKLQSDSKRELDILMLYYAFSDQHGVVDIKACAQWAKDRLGVKLQIKPTMFTKADLVKLEEAGVVPSISDYLSQFSRD